MVAGPLVSLLVEYLKPKQAVQIISRKTFLSFVFVLLAYPFILPFLVTLLFLSKLSNRIGLTKKFWLIFFAYFFLLIFGLWDYFADQRVKNVLAFRSWGSFLTPVSIFQYFGVFPGNVMGSRYLGVIQSISQDLGITTSVDFFLLSIPILISVATLIFLAISEKRIYNPTLVSLISGTILIMLIVAFTSRDSYYFYKVSYVFQFIVIGVCITGTTKLLSYLKVKKMYLLRNLIVLILLSVVALNLIWSSYSSVEMLKRNKDWSTFSSDIKNLSEPKIAKSVSLIEEGGDEYITNYLISSLRRNYNEANQTEYGIFVDSAGTKRSIEIEELASDTLRPSPAGIFGTEESELGKFRWISGYIFKGRSGVGIKLTRLNASGSDRRVTVCTELAPWSPFAEIEISVTDEDNTQLGSIEVLKQASCSSFSIQKNSEEIFLLSNSIGTYPSLFDRRKILYRLWDQDGTYFRLID
jgi:hypothetical protein